MSRAISGCTECNKYNTIQNYLACITLLASYLACKLPCLPRFLDPNIIGNSSRLNKHRNICAIVTPVTFAIVWLRSA